MQTLLQYKRLLFFVELTSTDLSHVRQGQDEGKTQESLTVQNLTYLASELHETEHYTGLILERFSRTSLKKIFSFTQVVKPLSL